MITYLVCKVIKTGRRVETFEESARVAQFVAPLAVRGPSAYMQSALRRRIDINQSGPVCVVKTEYVRYGAVSEIHTPVHPSGEEVISMFPEAFLVNAEIMTVDIEVALVLSRGAIAVRSFIPVAQNKAYVIRRIPRNNRSYHSCVVIPESLASVEILKPAVILICVGSYLYADGIANRASD